MTHIKDKTWSWKLISFSLMAEWRSSYRNCVAHKVQNLLWPFQSRKCWCVLGATVGAITVSSFLLFTHNHKLYLVQGQIVYLSWYPLHYMKDKNTPHGIFTEQMLELSSSWLFFPSCCEVYLSCLHLAVSSPNPLILLTFFVDIRDHFLWILNVDWSPMTPQESSKPSRPGWKCWA